MSSKGRYIVSVERIIDKLLSQRNSKYWCCLIVVSCAEFWMILCSVSQLNYDATIDDEWRKWLNHNEKETFFY